MLGVKKIGREFNVSLVSLGDFELSDSLNMNLQSHTVTTDSILEGKIFLESFDIFDSPQVFFCPLKTSFASVSLQMKRTMGCLLQREIYIQSETSYRLQW